MSEAQTPGGNTTTAGAVEMARRIVEEFYDLPSSEVADNCSEIAIALAAIIETQELIENFVGAHSRHADPSDIAAAIRAGTHLKGPKP